MCVVCCAFVRCALCVLLVCSVWVLACVFVCVCVCWCWCVTLTPHPSPPSSPPASPSHPPLSPCVRSKRLPPLPSPPQNVHSERPRVYWHHARKCYHMCAWCRYTRGRVECTHGGFSACRTRTHHDHNDIHTRHNNNHETRRDETRQEKTSRLVPAHDDMCLVVSDSLRGS